MTNKCKCCGELKYLRFGFCWECAECESVISEGLDMIDNPITKNEGFSSHMDKLKYILDKYKLLKQKKIKTNESK